MSKDKQKTGIWKSAALLLTLAVLWGAAYPLTKVAVASIPPVTVAAVRATVAALCLLAVLGSRAGRLWQTDFPWHAYPLQGILNCVLPWLLVAWASLSVSSGVATVLNSLSPLFIFLITWAITRHEPAPPRKLAGVLLGIAGVIAIVGPAALSGLGTQLIAQAACVAGSISYAVAAIVGRRFDRTSPLVPAAGAALMAALMLVPAALAIDRPWALQPSYASVAALLVLGSFSTGLPLIIYFRLLSTIGSLGTSSQAYLRILVGAALGVLFLGEALPHHVGVGLALVITAVAAMTLPAQRTATQAAS